MLKAFYLIPLFAICVWAQNTSPQTEPKAESLCSLQQTIRQGDHLTVRVSGVFITGPEGEILEDPACRNENAWVELKLRSQQNREKLRKILDKSQSADVVFDGEFYGPPLSDPKLPEAIRKAYHPGWGHLGGFRTQLIVYQILDVEPAPADPN